MSTLTPNYDLIKPAVNDPTDQDLWGGYLNSNFDIIDTQLLANNKYPMVTKTIDYTVLTTDLKTVFLSDATGAEIEYTLPSAVTATAGFSVTFVKIDSTSNNIIITPDGSETINDDVDYRISTQFESVTLVSDGSNWVSIGKSQASGLPTRTYKTSGSGNHIAVKTGTLRVYGYGAGGGGHGGDGNNGIRAGTGGDTTVTYSATTYTAGGGLGGIWTSTNIDAPAMSTATNGDINISGGGAIGGNSGNNGNNNITDGRAGAMFIKDLIVTAGDTIAYSVGAGGTKLTAGFVDATDGASGYIIFEQ